MESGIKGCLNATLYLISLHTWFYHREYRDVSCIYNTYSHKILWTFQAIIWSASKKTQADAEDHLEQMNWQDLVHLTHQYKSFVKDWNMEEILALRAFLCLSCLPDNHQGCGLVQHAGDEHVNHQDNDPAMGRIANLIDCHVVSFKIFWSLIAFSFFSPWGMFDF